MSKEYVGITFGLCEGTNQKYQKAPEDIHRTGVSVSLLADGSRGVACDHLKCNVDEGFVCNFRAMSLESTTQIGKCTHLKPVIIEAEAE